MKLKKIRLRHFRQFYGDQELQIAGPGKKNVTLVHAENGVGKTTLLNAVLWTFFGDTTGKFEKREQILNFEAESEGDRDAVVEVTFQHEDSDYVAIRRQTENPERSRTRFDVSKINANGSYGPPLLNPEAFVNTVIPRAMAPYFFFDGEQAETFSAEKSNKAVAAAIRDILGCTLVETAHDDLQYVARKYNEELGGLQGEDEIRKRESRITELQDAIDNRKRTIGQLADNIVARQQQLADIESKLRGAQAAAEFQIDRESKARLLGDIATQISETECEVLRWIGSRSASIVARKLTAEVMSFIDEESLRGRIPSPYNEEFVKGLLQAKKCICGRGLEPGEVHWHAVQEMLKNAANAEVMSRVVRSRARIEALKEAREDAPAELAKEEKRLASLLGNRRQLEQEIEELGKKLEGLPVAEIQERERARKQTSAALDDDKRTTIRLERDNEHDVEEIKRLNAEVSDLARRNEKARRLVVRRDVVLASSELLNTLLEKYEEQARGDIETAVNRILAKTARKHYKLQIDPTFELRLLFSDGRVTPKSGGENQLMSLAFIAALVEYAEKRSQESRNELFIPATVAPLILDSPFGQLDDSYRADTAAFVPAMAPQVILLVSSSQGKQEVLAALDGRVGTEYVLIAENRGPKGDKSQDFMTVNGRRMATTLFNCERNLTRIEKV